MKRDLNPIGYGQKLIFKTNSVVMRASQETICFYHITFVHCRPVEMFSVVRYLLGFGLQEEFVCWVFRWDCFATSEQKI